MINNILEVIKRQESLLPAGWWRIAVGDPNKRLPEG
jgi:hypothetical protein